ncbi:MAG: 2-hydroxyacyl-CoA dehydratase [Candidatus Helarchaeota archaeon]
MITRSKERNIQILKDIYDATSYTEEFILKCTPEHEQRVLRAFLKYLNPTFKSYIDKFEEGKPVIGYHFAFPGEIFRAFDCVPIVMEAMPYLYAAILPVGQGPQEYYDAMVAFSHPYHTCSAQSGTMGMALKDKLEMDAVVCPSGPCDSGKASYQYYPVIKEIPLVVTDIPFRHDSRSYDYYAVQLENMLNKVGEIINQEPDYGKMKKAVENANKCTELISEINILRRNNPIPIENMFNPISVAAASFMGGLDDSIKFYQEVLEIGKSRQKNGEIYGLPDKVRSIWPYMSVFFDIGFSEWLDKVAGFAQVLDIFSYYFFDITKYTDFKSMLRSLAVKVMEYPMERHSISFAEVFLDDFLKLAKNFSADCAIMTQHLGCKQILSMDQLIREVLRDELGIPTLSIEIDIGDSRYNPIEKIKDEILEFKRTLF